MLSGFGENPAAESVDNELQIASNNGILNIYNKMISKIVKPTYIFHKADAVFLILGVNLSSVGPGASAKNL